mgnify:CR=1 FL=1
MTLTIYNTLTRHKEAFQSIEPQQVRMYCCGITVYDYCHLGHARTCLIWDVVRNYLQWRGYKVQYIQNFTDIDDKILNRARLEGTSMEEVAERFIEAYFADMESLKINKADVYPRATHSLDGIKNLITQLEINGYAYQANGDVYYAVDKFAPYGKLSGRKLEDLQAGASGRIEATAEAKKKNPFDFALWKSAKPGEPSWDSSWGKGRPGWHIECSAMVKEYLGETIDIHVGGNDLIFPHHENEIAQSEAATGKPLANYWLHNGMVKVDGEKMSKSLGNFTTIRDLLARRVDPMAVRLFILQAHYRKPIDFTREALNAAEAGWQTLQEGLLLGDNLNWQLSSLTIIPSITQRFQEAVDDDFNFAEGLAIVFEIAKELRKQANLIRHQGETTIPLEDLQQQWATLVELARVLGFILETKAEVTPTGLTDADIEGVIQQRQEARKQKNYAESDRLRDELQKAGITLIDKPGGVTDWYRE